MPALDVRRGVVLVRGWREAAPRPAVLVTDVERDGTAAGPNLELARRVARACGQPALLSGGVRSLDDLRAAASAAEIAGVVVGRALLEGRFSVADALAACRGAEVAR